MRRLCIYVTYDPENRIDGYIRYMLQEMRKTVDSLILICNYKYAVFGLNDIQPYVDKIFYRENEGFDAGAYKDSLCQYLGWNVVSEYDELILVNDSFYGPVYPLEKLFKRMEEEDADYWGMTRCPEGELADGSTYKPHIQSYFLALRKNILTNKEFQSYWEDMEYPASFMQTVKIFEIGINKLLRQLGFIGSAVMDLCPVQWNLNKNENPYLRYPLELIRDAGIPILKRKSLSLSNKGFESAIKALRFIKDECSYDVCLIENHLRRIREGINIVGIDIFYASHPRVFIYGAGAYGKKVAEYFAYKGWTFEKFLVTDMAGCSTNYSSNCITFEEADITEDDGIIIAVCNKKVFREIVGLVKKRCRKEQIFNLEDIIW